MTTTAQAAPEAHSGDSFDRDYWLSHCEGFRVDTVDGRLGFVEEIRAGRDPAGNVLVVRAGLLGRRIVLVPAAAVGSVVPRAEQVWLRSPVTILGSEPGLPVAFEIAAARLDQPA